MRGKRDERLCVQGMLAWGHRPSLPPRLQLPQRGTPRYSLPLATHDATALAPNLHHALSRPPRPPFPLPSSVSLASSSPTSSSSSTESVFLTSPSANYSTKHHAPSPTIRPTIALQPPLSKSPKPTLTLVQTWPLHSPTCLAPRLPGLPPTCASDAPARTRKRRQKKRSCG